MKAARLPARLDDQHGGSDGCATCFRFCGPAPSASACRAIVLLLPALALPGCGAANAVKNTFFGAPAPTTGQLGARQRLPRRRGRRRAARRAGRARRAVAAAATRPTPRWRSASRSPSRCPRAPGSAAAARASPMRRRQVGATAASRRRSCSSRRRPRRRRRGPTGPAAVPMLARGLYLLHARYGHLPFEIADRRRPSRRRGSACRSSRAFAQDLAVVAGPLLADPAAAAVFGRSGQPLARGAAAGRSRTSPRRWRSCASAASAISTRARSPRRLADAVAARRRADRRWPTCAPRCRALAPALSLPIADDDKVAFLPPPADGGLAAAAAFRVLQHEPGRRGGGPGARARGARALARAAAATRWRC